MLKKSVTQLLTVYTIIKVKIVKLIVDIYTFLHQTALKHDRKNYNALLLFGRACQELGKMEDCKKALTVCF